MAYIVWDLILPHDGNGTKIITRTLEVFVTAEALAGPVQSVVEKHEK